jgi:uncharacterized 2Fe-2S/4Fe-4S cluster protein (DUF4445 family)
MSAFGRTAMSFVPSGRTLVAAEGDTILDAAQRVGEPLSAECGGRGACGRCLVRVVQGDVPDYRVMHHAEGQPEVLACLTPIQGPLTILPLVEADLPKLVTEAMIDAIFVAGDPAQCRDKMQEVSTMARAHGYAQLRFSELGPDLDLGLRLLCDEILPHL